MKRVRVIKCREDGKTGLEAANPSKKHISTEKRNTLRRNGKFIYCYCDNELFELLRSFEIFSHLENKKRESNRAYSAH